MTSKEKAKELVEKFRLNVLDYEGCSINSHKAKQCALVAVDEILNTGALGSLLEEYYQQVKQDLNQNKMENLETTAFKIATSPQPVGGYRFGHAPTYCTQINLNYKPKWLHRQCMRIFFGMYWFEQFKKK